MRSNQQFINNTNSSFSNSLKIQHIVRLKRFAKMWRLKIQKRMNKNRQYRFNIINQWIQTQTNYVRDLNIIIHNMKTPMKQKAILTQQQLKIVFANIQAILLLSQRLLEELIKIKDNWQPDTIMISLKLNKFYPYLKIYSEYYNNYHISHNIITEIKNLEDVQEISKALAMDFESYLIKPIQSPLKYELLMKQYWGHMPRSHPDYNGIKDTIQKYTKVNTSNNDQLGQREKIAKIIRLGKLYSELVKPGRQLIKQFVASTFFITVVKVYLLTDLILITRDQNGKQMFQKVIELDGRKSFIEYKNSIYSNDLTVIVCGIRDSIHLKFMSRNLMNFACSQIKQVISKLYQKQRARMNIINRTFSKKQDFKTTTALSFEMKELYSFPQIKAVCYGVYKRAVSVLKNRTYYIIKLSFGSESEFCQFIFIRFSQIQKLRQSLCRKYNSILFPQLSPNLSNIKQMSMVDISIDPANIVSYRTYSIPQFLNFVFRCEKVMSQPLPMLSVLGIEDNFWYYFKQKQVQQCRCKLCRNSQKRLSIKQTLNLRQKYLKMCQGMNKDQFCLIKHMKDRANLLSIPTKQFVTLQQQLLYLQYKQGRINYNMIDRNKSKIQFNIRVSLMSLQHGSAQIKINEQSTVGQVLDAMCKYYRMYNYKDFALFIQDQKEMRLLDQDEFIYQILKQSQEKIEPVEYQGFCFNINTLTNWSKKIFKPKSSKLYFGKYLFLNSELQKAACRASPIRYRFIIEQIFYYIHKKLIVLSDSQLKRIVALYLCLRLQQQIQRLSKQNIPLQKIYNFVSSQQVTTKWILQIINIVTAQRNLIQGSNFFMMVYDRIIQIIQNKPGWKSMLFSVTQYKQSKPIYIGINIDGFLVIQKNSNNVLLSIPIHLLRFRMSPFSVTIQFNELQCTFEGTSLFNFSKMAEKYYLLNQLFKSQNKKMSLCCSQQSFQI